jgi:myo-inositol-1(or 4)-monophosphatase
VIDFRPETRAATEAVRVGLTVVLSREAAHDVRVKGPNDLVTGTDLLSQAAIERALKEREPSIAFVGEEGEARIPDAARYWLVDPVCGTSNFAAGLPFYAVNVALVEAGQVTVGAVGDGVTGEVYVAERGSGAWRLDNASAQRLQVNRTARVVSIDDGLPGPGALHRFPAEFAIRVLAEQRWDVRMLASTLALAYLARGSLAGAVYVCGGLPVHFAAGLRLAEEAGALVSDEHCQPWTLFGPVYVAAANNELQRELARLARQTVEALQPS